MIDQARPIWWHVHSGPPYICHGGAGWTVKDAAEDLAAVHFEEGTAVVVIESLDPPEWCAYRIPGWAVLHGVVMEA